MKRRNKSWLIAALVALSAVMVLTGCSLSQVLSLTIVDYPATTYVRSNTTPDIEFTVAAEMDDGETRELTYSRYSSVLKLSGFSTEEIGTFTATVTYRNVSATFDYEVVEASSDFAGGVGTETNPYIINTVEQFLKIDDGIYEPPYESTSVYNFSAGVGHHQPGIGENAAYRGGSKYAGCYFKLGADLDFTGIGVSEQDATQLGAYAAGEYYYTLLGAFSGNLDGAGYKIYNVGIGISAGASSPEGLIALLQNGTIKNLDYYVDSFIPMVVWAEETNHVENVDCYGTMLIDGGSNNCAYVVYNFGHLTMVDCNNYVNIFGNSSYAGAFLGQPSRANDGNSSLTMTNCNNYGRITGIKAAAFFANANSGYYVIDITMENCVNYGEIIGSNANLFFATPNTFDDPNMVATGEEEKVIDENRTASLTWTNCSNGTSGEFKGKVVPLTSEGYYTAQVAKDGTITVTTVNAAITKVVVLISYYSKNEAGTLLRSAYEELYFSAETSEAKTNNIKQLAIRKVTDQDDLTAEGVVEIIEGVLYLVEEDGNWTYVHADESHADLGNSKVTVDIMAYAGENLIAGGKL